MIYRLDEIIIAFLRQFYKKTSPPFLKFMAEFLAFGIRQALACAFAGTFLLLLMVSRHITIPGVYRYDLLFYGAVIIQCLLIALKMENAREVAVLSLFHALGTVLELFKTSPEVGSWHYPELAIFKIATVPLYAGFMYAAVASYMMQAWRFNRLRLQNPPPLWLAVLLCAAIYINFFTNHWLPDIRLFLFAAVFVVFYRTKVYFTPLEKERHMPMILAFMLIGFFIWVAENIATFGGAWKYPHQLQQWAIVGPGKITSWALLVILSFIIVASLKQVFPKKEMKTVKTCAE